MSDYLLSALMEISLGRGAYCRDPLEQADNCIKSMKETAINAIAESYWHRDYPTGGSIYRTYASTPFHDKELYIKEANNAIEKYKYAD